MSKKTPLTLVELEAFQKQNRADLGPRWRDRIYSIVHAQQDPVTGETAEAWFEKVMALDDEVIIRFRVA